MIPNSRLAVWNAGCVWKSGNPTKIPKTQIPKMEICHTQNIGKVLMSRTNTLLTFWVATFDHVFLRANRYRCSQISTSSSFVGKWAALTTAHPRWANKSKIRPMKTMYVLGHVATSSQLTWHSVCEEIQMAQDSTNGQGFNGWTRTQHNSSSTPTWWINNLGEVQFKLLPISVITNHMPVRKWPLGKKCRALT